MEPEPATFATREGTDRYRRRFQSNAAENHFRLEQDLYLSSIGIGTYLGNPDTLTDQKYQAAVTRAVQLGANVIDTAANYRFQRSERSIGTALKQLITQHGFARDELVVCTKGGYLPFDGAAPRDVHAYIQDTFVAPGIAGFDDIVGGSHCMTPAYLQNQLEQSLKNLGLECIDVYYIHNPESQLGEVSEDQFYERLRSAFAMLESNVKAGKIRMYGVATWNGFRQPLESAGGHSLAKMVALAEAAGGEDHGFRFIQLPFNLAMPEALMLPNQKLDNSEPVTLLAAAAALGVSVVSSASILQGRVAHGLSESIREPLGSLATDALTAIQFVRSTPGITTALIGMSSLKHVEENMQLAQIEPAHREDYARLFSGA
ncbi:MAG TPA: aldo/keto reductase [Pyrinomonadaceae bacterium]|nr:aldo/keto reductase [Pyrinomonadaceae bacterium]